MEKSVKLKATSTVMGAALVMGGAMVALPAQASAQDINADAAFVQNATELGLEDAAGASRAEVQKVEGTFSFSQDIVTSNGDIANVFQKAAATLCQAMPEYAAAGNAGSIEVNGPDASFAATVDEMAGDEDFGSIVGCACATNGPGGGAIANAEVQGVALATIATLAQII